MDSKLKVKFKEFIESSGEDCDGVLYTLEVLSSPQIGFPLPGEPEINVIARVSHCDNGKTDDPESFPAASVGDVVVVICQNNAIQPVGQSIYCLYWLDFYFKNDVKDTLMRSVAGGRFCQQVFDDDTI
jgi:hypothetical protein